MQLSYDNMSNILSARVIRVSVYFSLFLTHTKKRTQEAFENSLKMKEEVRIYCFWSNLIWRVNVKNNRGRINKPQWEPTYIWPSEKQNRDGLILKLCIEISIQATVGKNLSFSACTLVICNNVRKCIGL
jgi:hypothetical protein